MKKLLRLLVVMVFLAFPFRAHAQLGVFDGAVHALLGGSFIENIIFYAESIAQQVANVTNTYQQVQHMIRAEKRALENLKSIADVKNFDDFMRWQNRQLFLEREAQSRFDNLGVKIGDTTYKREDIQKISEALKTSYGDPFGKDLTEEQRMEMYVTTGLSPGNYNYVKMWSDQEKELAQNLLTKKAILDAENTDAAERYNDQIGQYASGEEMDTNQILKNIHMSLMQQEMAQRDQTRLMAEMNEYQLAKDNLAKAGPNPPRLSPEWNSRPFKKITNGEGKNGYR